MVMRFLLFTICMLGMLVPRSHWGDETSEKTLVYKRIPQGELAMAVHFPSDWKETDKRPALVFFFGGGWSKGDSKQFEEQAAHFAKRGMVTVRADYRVKSRQGVTPDKCVEDAKSAVRYLRQHASELGIDPSRIVASGGSAGGHIAACTALTPGLDAEGENQEISSKPNAMILFNPVLSFVDVPQLMTRIDNNAKLAEQISPTRHITKETPPALILFGTDDRLYAQGKDFIQRSKEVGNCAEIFTAEGEPHGFFNRPPWKEKTIKRADEFLVSLGYLQADGK